MNNFTEKVVKIPLDCLLCLPPTESDNYVTKATTLPKNTYNLFSSARIGSYIVGLTKHHDLPLEKTSVISFLTLQVALGERTLAQLPAALSAELQVANDTAQKIAKEIENDLFTPIMMELNNYLAKKKEASKPKSPTEGIGNVVNLKDKPKPNKPFPLPPKQ